MIEEEKCWFCNNPISDDNYNLFVTLKRQYYAGPYLKTEKTTESIPRCKSCKQKHDDVNFYAWSRGIVIAIIFIIIFLFYFRAEILTSFLIGGFLGLSTGFIIFRSIGEKKFLKGILLQREIQNHPKILLLKAQGWRVGH